MSLVYLLTGLPPLHRGAEAPISLNAFIAVVRANLEGKERTEFERLALLEEVEAGVRVQSEALLDNPSIKGQELRAAMYDRDPATEGGTAVSELPEWMHRPRPLRAHLRRFWHDVVEETGNLFLREWAMFIVDLQEVCTALLAKRRELKQDEFLVQMRGSFDTTSRYIIAHYDAADAGIGDRFAWVGEAIAALDNDDLQAGERALNDIRWRSLDALVGTDPFGLDAVLAYYLRLRIVRQEASWTAEKGQAVLDNVLGAATTVIDNALAAPPAPDELEAA